MGEDMGGEFNEMAGRLEAGEDPQAIENELGLGGADAGAGAAQLHAAVLQHVLARLDNAASR